MRTKSTTDRAAVAFSMICLAHCLLLPAIAIVLPFAAVVADLEWVHWLMAVLAVIASGSVALSGSAARTPAFLVPAGLGGILIIGALFAENFGIDETAPTVIGGVLIAAAHLRRLWRITEG